MKNLEILSEQEMRAINGGGFISNFAGFLVNAVTSVATALITGIKFIESLFNPTTPTS
jgi:hypothetical protein